MAGVFLVGVHGDFAGARQLLAWLERDELCFRLLLDQRREPHVWLLFDAEIGAGAVERTRELRRVGFVGAIVVASATAAMPVIEAGYRVGADDWNAGPLCCETIGARLRQILRKRFPEATDEVTVDIRTWRDPVAVDGHQARLTETEFALFLYLLESRDRWVKEEELIREVLRAHHQNGSSVVRFHIQHLREKLPWELIWTDHGYNLSLRRLELERRRGMASLRKGRRGSGKMRRVG